MFHTFLFLCRQVASKLTSSRTPSTFHTTSPGWVASVLPYIYLHLDAIFKQHTSILPGRQFPPVSVDAAKHTRSVLYHQHRSLFTIVTVFTKICTSTATRFFLSIWSCLCVCVYVGRNNDEMHLSGQTVTISFTTHGTGREGNVRYRTIVPKLAIPSTCF